MSGEGGLGLGVVGVVIVTRRCWGVRDASVVVVGEGGGLGVGVGDARVVVTVINTLVLGWWLLLSLAGR